MLTTLSFPSDAAAATASVGLPDLPIISLTIPTTAGKDPAELEKVAREVQQPLIDGLTKMPANPKVKAATEAAVLTPAKLLSFKGKTVNDAADAMEQFFLANRMTDGFPLVPPTEARVKEMIAASGLAADKQIGIIDPRKGVATVEMLAINAVMAGCRPAYMPVLVAIAQAMADPDFDMHGCMATTGLNAPLVIVSGPIIEQLGLNYSYSTAGPGWRSNSTIGRASRLFIINIAQAWPGINDMKDVGNPAKFGIVIAENEKQTPQGWGTLREREGFAENTSTISIYASQSYRQVHDSQKYLVPTVPYQNIVDPMIARTFATSLNAGVEQWGEELLLVFSPVMANNLAKMGYTPKKIQEELFKEARVPRKLYGPRPLGSMGEASGVPKWIDEAKDDDMVPVVPTPEDFRIVVAGGTGGGASFAVDRWGFGNSKFVTKEVKLPSQWPQLVKDLEKWNTPIVVR